jgi:hypothetical protein
MRSDVARSPKEEARERGGVGFSSTFEASHPAAKEVRRKT